MNTDTLKDMYTWLVNNHPGPRDVMVIKVTHHTGQLRWLVCACGTRENGQIMFTLNERLYYDYLFLWNNANEWEIVWKS